MPTFSLLAEKSKSPSTHPHHFLQGNIKEHLSAKNISAPLPSIVDIFLARCSSKANRIVKDPTHPSHSLLQVLPSGRQYRSIRAHSARLLNIFGCESPELNSPRPSLKPHTNPLPPETWTITPSPPQTPSNLTTSQNKL